MKQNSNGAVSIIDTLSRFPKAIKAPRHNYRIAVKTSPTGYSNGIAFSLGSGGSIQGEFEWDAMNHNEVTPWWNRY